MTETLFHNVSFGERLAFQNVVSSRARFHYSETAAHLAEFVEQVAAAGCDPKGPLFYSLNNVPMDEIVDIEMFLPVRDNRCRSGESLLFHSYFEVSPLLRGVVKGDFENRTEQTYAELLTTLEANGMEINSPFFHVVQKEPIPYALIYLGYAGTRSEGGAR